MAYSHTWKRPLQLDSKGFKKASEEIRLVLKKVEEMGAVLAGPMGDGDAQLSDSCIAFNGAKECGHPYLDIGEPYPTEDAEGISTTEPPIADGEPYFSGPYLESRYCGGNCAGGSFVVDRQFLVRSWERPKAGLYFSKCETKYKPYDLAVTAALVRLKENLGEDFLVWSDGDDKAFEDAKRLCRELFGWNRKFKVEIDPEEAENVKAK